MTRILLLFLTFFPLAAWAQGQPSSNDFWDRGWEVASESERLALINELDLETMGVDASLLSVAVQPLPWSSDLQLFRVGGGWQPENLFFYYVGQPDGTFARLDGTSPPIHNLNAEYPPQFTLRTAAQYVWFFGFFVRGEEGPFLVAESASDTFVPDTDVSGAQLADGATSLDQLLQPLTCVTDGSSGGFICPATVYYSNAIFNVVFRLEPSGMIQMLGDTARASDLPVLVNAPITRAEVDEFQPRASGWISEQVALQIVESLSSSDPIEWTIRNNYVIASVASALLGRCRTELSAGSRASLAEITNFTLAGLIANMSDETPEPQPSGGFSNSSVLGMGLSLVEGLDCEAEANDLAFNIVFHRLGHLSASPFFAGCSPQYGAQTCLCYANGSSTIYPEMISQDFSYALVEEFFALNTGVAYSVLYNCGELVP